MKPIFRRFWVLAVLAAGLLGVGGGIFLYSQNKNESATAVREAPRFELADAQGKKHRLEDWKGQVILIHFWATWCPPCLGEIPQWVELATDFKGRPLKLVAVSLDDSWAEAHKILPSDKLPPQITSILDPGGKVAELYGSYQYPETYLLNRDLQIVAKWVGPQDWKSPDLHQLLENLMKDASPKEALSTK